MCGSPWTAQSHIAATMFSRRKSRRGRECVSSTVKGVFGRKRERRATEKRRESNEEERTAEKGEGPKKKCPNVKKDRGKDGGVWYALMYVCVRECV